MNKVLKIERPLITTYTHHAYSLMALSGVKEAYKWIYCQYIQMFLNKDFAKNGWGDFYFPMPYEVKCYELCPYLRIEKSELSYITGKFAKVVDYIIESIDRGFYVHTMVDYFFISQSPFYKKRERRHDCFIYGYDDELKELYCADYMFSDVRKLSLGIIKFDEFEKGIRSAVEREDHILNRYILKMRPIESGKYDFNIHNLIYGLKSYLNCATPEYWMGYNYENKQEIDWGLNCYDVFIDNIIRTPEKADLRFIYMFMDHKKIMIERLTYLEKEVGIIGLENIIKDNNDLYSELYKTLNLLVKYSLCNKKEIIDQTCEIIRAVRSKEEKSLKSLISILENQ